MFHLILRRLVINVPAVWTLNDITMDELSTLNLC